MSFLGAAIYGGAAVFIAGIVIGLLLGEDPILEVSLPGFAFTFVAMVFVLWHGLPCPRCNKNLGTLLLQQGGFRTDKEVQFCPYCGTGIDDEMA